jgi:hypothetical protein
MKWGDTYLMAEPEAYYRGTFQAFVLHAYLVFWLEASLNSGHGMQSLQVCSEVAALRGPLGLPDVNLEMRDEYYCWADLIPEEGFVYSHPEENLADFQDNPETEVMRMELIQRGRRPLPLAPPE